MKSNQLQKGMITWIAGMIAMVIVFASTLAHLMVLAVVAGVVAVACFVFTFVRAWISLRKGEKESV